jgi:hypothetical protein
VALEKSKGIVKADLSDELSTGFNICRQMGLRTEYHAATVAEDRGLAAIFLNPAPVEGQRKKQLYC